LCNEFPGITARLSTFTPEAWEAGLTNCLEAVVHMREMPHIDNLVQEVDLYPTLEYIFRHWKEEEPIIRFATYYFCRMVNDQWKAFESLLSDALKNADGPERRNGY
jgi:hypothetical protein